MRKLVYVMLIIISIFACTASNSEEELKIKLTVKEGKASQELAITWNVEGGVKPYVYRFKLNDLPWSRWDSFNNVCYIPILTGTHVFIIEVKDSLGNIASKELEIKR